MKRRAFICGGMAAILAARRAPAFCIAMRNGMMRRGAPTPPLPYDAEVEYLESTGTQWIDTGIYGRDGLHIEAVATRDLSVSTGTKFVFGVMPNVMTVLAVSVNVGDGKVTTGLYSTPASTSGAVVSDGEFHSYVLDTTSGAKFANVDDVEIRTLASSGTGQTSSSVRLFGAFVANTFNSSSCRFSSFSVMDTTTNQLLIDLISVRFTNEQGVSEGVMYDRVSGQLFRNAGTGAFTIGPDKS